MRYFVLFLLLMPAPVAALEICDELWFARNLLFHRAGYCFGSELGQAVFDNTDCVEGAVELGPLGKEIVERVKAAEAEFECAVDIRQDFLAVPQQALRIAIVDIPFPVDAEIACVGWKGERLPLHTERREDAVVTGAARIGDTLLFQFEDVDGWSFVEVQQNGIPAGAGWSQVEISEEHCTAVAG